MRSVKSRRRLAIGGLVRPLSVTNCRHYVIVAIRPRWVKLMFRKMCSILLFHILIAGYWDLTPIRILINGHQKMEHLSGNSQISQITAGGAARGVKCDVLTIICPNLVVIRALPPPPRTCRPVYIVFVSGGPDPPQQIQQNSGDAIRLYDKWVRTKRSLFIFNWKFQNWKGPILSTQTG